MQAKSPRTPSCLPAASVPLIALALIGAAVRIGIRLHYQRRLYVDDGFFFFAIICLCVGTGIMYKIIPSMYLVEAILTNDPNIYLPSDFIAQSLSFHKLGIAFLVLTYNAIFAVKYSFLFFFRALIRRVHKMLVYWWTVAVLTAVVWAYGLIGLFATCPHFDFRALKCAQASKFPVALGISATMIALDILTDILIIIIPIRMLWNMQVKMRQKLAIGTALCLSIAMIITCIIQISHIRTVTNTIDVTWEIFWQLVEACIAVLMVSLTALRSVFVGHGSRARRSPKESWSSRQAKRWLKRSPLGTPDRFAGLPKIPRATLTGMRTFIRGNGDAMAGSVMQSGDLEEGEKSADGCVMQSRYVEEGEKSADVWALPPLKGATE